MGAGFFNQIYVLFLSWVCHTIVYEYASANHMTFFKMANKIWQFFAAHYVQDILEVEK